jgi:hypothetical protein
MKRPNPILIMVAALAVSATVVAFAVSLRSSRAASDATATPSSQRAESARRRSDPPSERRFVTIPVDPPAARAPDESEAPLTPEQRHRLIVEERDAKVNEVRSSGAANGEHSRALELVRSSWREMVDAGVRDNVRFGSFECYRRGCVAELRAKDRSSLDSFASKFPFSPGFQQWPGGKFKSGSVTAQDNSAVEHWIFYLDNL